MTVKNLKQLLLFCLIYIITSCGHKERAGSTILSTKTVLNKSNNNQINVSAQSWFDSIKILYSKTTSNALVRNTVKDSSITEEWEFDDIVKTDTANYFAYKIGHDISDNDGSRFVTDVWIYVDTVKRKLYQYQPDGKLREWQIR